MWGRSVHHHNPVNSDLWHSKARRSSLRKKKKEKKKKTFGWRRQLHLRRVAPWHPSNTFAVSPSRWKKCFHTINQLKLWKISARSKQAGKQRPHCCSPRPRFRSDVWRESETMHVYNASTLHRYTILLIISYRCLSVYASATNCVSNCR